MHMHISILLLFCLCRSITWVCSGIFSYGTAASKIYSTKIARERISQKLIRRNHSMQHYTNKFSTIAKCRSSNFNNTTSYNNAGKVNTIRKS